MKKQRLKTGLKVLACIFNKVYETDRKVVVQFKKSMRIVFDARLKRWNYVAIPVKVEL